MPSSYSASLRFTLQATGENNNTWGAILNSGAFQLIDTAIAGWTTIALTGDLTLSTALGAADQARSAVLKFTGAGPFTVTVPAVSKKYTVWNACVAVLTISNGTSSVTVQPGETVAIATDGGSAFRRVAPTDFGGLPLTAIGSISLSGGTGIITGLASPTTDAQPATKKYVDDTAFTANAGILPGQVGNSGKFLTTNGLTASWAAISVATITDYASDQAAKTAAATGLAVAFAVAL